MCIFSHRWRPRSAQHVRVGMVWTADADLSPATYILYVCETCGNSRTEERKGHWNLRDLEPA